VVFRFQGDCDDVLGAIPINQEVIDSVKKGCGSTAAMIRTLKVSAIQGRVFEETVDLRREVVWFGKPSCD